MARGGFERRSGQQRMATAVFEALSREHDLVVEAGTGTGKTLAYLIPALLYDEPTILSTGTKALQEQLLRREVPVAAKTLSRLEDRRWGRTRARVVVLKGRENYLCVKRLEESDTPLFGDYAHEAPLLARIRDWAETTSSGDRADLEDLPDRSRLWQRLDGRADTCTGAQCAHYESCFVTKARRAASAAHVVVVNHHLLFADLALRLSGRGRILPPARRVVLDEAHLAQSAAVAHFGTRLSLRMLVELANDAALELPASGRSAQPATHLGRLAREFFAAIRPSGGRVAWDPSAIDEKVETLMERMIDAWGQLAAEAEGEGKRAEERTLLIARCDDQRRALSDFVSGEHGMRVLTVEAQGRHGAALASWPLDVGSLLCESFSLHFDAVVATSATLSVGGDLRRAAARLGLPEAERLIVSSPFSRSQAALYVPERFPEPKDPAFAERSLREIEELLSITRGRALVLFASHRALLDAASRFRDALEWPVLIQGDAPREVLIESFRSQTDSVLFGTASFRQGIDVPGEALSLVIVDKLPFAVPDDPVVAARARLLREQGKDPFMDEQLPEAVLALRQALGRLIRSGRDRGLLALLDIRVRTRRYGKVVLSSLPEWTLLEDIEQARAWFHSP